MEREMGQDFLHPSRLVLKPTSPPCTMSTGTLPRGKAARAWCDYTPPSSNDVKERVQPYLWALMARYIGIFTFTFTYTIATLDPLLISGRVKG